MPVSEDRIAQAVEEVLGPAWERERRRALWRWRRGTAARVVGGLVGVWGLALTLRFVVGMTLPWTFFAFIGFLMTVGGFSQPEGREHLREPQAGEPGRAGMPGRRVEGAGG